MKVILLRDVARIGKKGSMVEVPDGYAFNQLIPSKSAEAATPQNMKKWQRTQEMKSAEKEADSAQFSEIKSLLKGKSLEIAAEANDKDHLFKAIGKEEVVAAAKAAGAAIAADDVVFAKPVKSLGEHTALLSHGGDKIALTIQVIKK